MPGEPLVDEREVGVDQVEHAPVFPHHGLEEPLGLLDHRRPEVVVEGREPLAVAVDRPDVANLKPLVGEVLDEGLRLRVGEHPPDLPFEVVAGPQLPLAGEREQLVVGHAAPEEVREPRGQLELADRHHLGRLLRGVLRILRLVRPPAEFDPEEELRRDEDRFHGELNPALEALAVLLGDVHELEQAGDLALSDRAAIGTGREPFEDLAGDLGLVPVRRLLEDDPPVRLGLRGVGGKCGPLNLQLIDHEVPVPVFRVRGLLVVEVVQERDPEPVHAFRGP